MISVILTNSVSINIYFYCKIIELTCSFPFLNIIIQLILKIFCSILFCRKSFSSIDSILKKCEIISLIYDCVNVHMTVSQSVVCILLTKTYIFPFWTFLYCRFTLFLFKFLVKLYWFSEQYLYIFQKCNIM